MKQSNKVRSMFRFSKRIVVAVSVFLAACELASAPQSHEVSVRPTEAWSGQEILLVSAGFASSGELPAVRLDTVPLSVRRVDDTTMAAMLPATSGLHTLTVSGPRLVPFEAPLRVYGYASVVEGPPIAGYVLPYPPAGPTAVLANGETGLVLADLQSGASQVFPLSMHAPWCMRGVGPSYDPTQVLLRFGPDPVSCGWVNVWDLRGTPRLLDSTSYTTSRLEARLGPATWLVSSHHMICTYGVANPGACFSLEETNAVRISPRADVAVPLIHYAHGAGLPVFDASSGLPRYFVRVLNNAGGAAFTPGGDSLYLFGEDSANLQPRGFRLLLLDLSSGSLLAASAIDSSALPRWSFAYDLVIADPWILVVSAGPAAITRPSVLVLDRRTLALTAVLRAPDEAQCSYMFCGELRLAVGPASTALPVYAIETSGGDVFLPFNGRSRVYRFELPLAALPGTPSSLALTLPR